MKLHHMPKNVYVIVPWVTEEEKRKFRAAWGIHGSPSWLIMQQDKEREGCGPTKNRGIDCALDRKAEFVVILDGDCYPANSQQTLTDVVMHHMEALHPQEVRMFETVTDPPSRGTPYQGLTVKMPVAASMGFWLNVPDYCAVRQLAHDGENMEFYQRTIHGKYFPLCGMNLAFNPSLWIPWCRFIDVPRFDDIWMGWLWQKEAYRQGYCFNLNGPMIYHARQSNVWKNLKQEAEHLEENEELWRKIATSGYKSYENLRKLLPC